MRAGKHVTGRFLGVVAALVALATFVALAATASPARAAPAGLPVGAWERTVVPFEDSAVVHAVEEGRVVYSERTSGAETTEVKLYDIASGATTLLLENVLLAGDPLLSGNHLLYTTYEASGDTGITRLYLRDLATGEVSRLMSSEVWRPEAVALTDKGAVWEQYPSTEASSGSEWQLIYYSFSTGTAVVLDEGGSPSYEHVEAANDEYILWLRIPALGPDGPDLLFDYPLIAYSTATGQKTEIAVPSLYRSYLTLEGHTLYHTAQAGESYELRAYDLATGADTKIADWWAPIQNPAVDDGWMAWAYWDRGGHLIAQNRNTGAQFRIDSAREVGGLELTGSILTWKALPSFQTESGDGQLFAADLSARTVTRLTDVQSVLRGWDTEDGVVACFTAGPGDDSWLADYRLEIYHPSDADDFHFFADVPPDHLYWTAVIGLKRLGAVAGYPTEAGVVSFRPDSSVSRGHFAKLLVEALDLPGEGDYVQTLAQLGILRGTAPGRLSPYDPLTRAQLGTLIVRAADTLGIGLLRIWDGDSPMASFDPTHGPNVAVAQFAGLWNGVASYKLGWDPWAPATRGEAAQVLWNLVTARGAERLD